MKLNKYIWNSMVVVLFAVLAFLGAPLARVHAAPLVVVETNDFSNSFSSPTEFNPGLDVGTNLIQGSTHSLLPYDSDDDYLRVSLPPNSRLAGLSFKVTDYTGSIGTIGFLNVLPEEVGNSGNVAFTGNGTQAVSFTIGDPNNIILYVQPPGAWGESTSCNYEIKLIVTPVEVVGGTAIYSAVEITFPSESGYSYQLQYTTDLNSNDWTSVGAVIQGLGGTMSAFDTTRNADQRFYRVVKL